MGLIVVIALFCAPPVVLAKDKVVLGHPEALSGQYAKAGEQAVGGIKAIVSWINKVHGGVRRDGKKVPLSYIVYDCESKKEAVTSLIARLVTVDKADAIMAPYSSGLTLRGAPVAESYKMLYLDHGGASDHIFQQGFQYIVQSIGPASRYHVGTLDLIRQTDPKATRVALAYENDEFAQAVMEGAAAAAKALGFDIIFKRTYPTGVTDLTPLLSDLKATRPDVILGGGHFEDGQLLNRQLADLDINVHALSLIAAATLPAFREALGTLAEGVMGPSQWEYGVQYASEEAQKVGLPWFGPSQDGFVQLFKQAVGKDLMPDYHAAEAGAAVLALVLGIEKAGTVEADAVRKALGDLQFMSFYGGWAIDQTGLQVGHATVDVQWQGGERVIVWPPAAQTGTLYYPMPTFADKAKGKLAMQK
jgi:branched-chain amino acid transport system substrate-binding protein